MKYETAEKHRDKLRIVLETVFATGRIAGQSVETVEQRRADLLAKFEPAQLPQWVRDWLEGYWSGLRDGARPHV